MMCYFIRDLFSKGWHLFCFISLRTFVSLPKVRKIFLEDIYDAQEFEEGLDRG